MFLVAIFLIYLSPKLYNSVLHFPCDIERDSGRDIHISGLGFPLLSSAGHLENWWDLVSISIFVRIKTALILDWMIILTNYGKRPALERRLVSRS